MRRTKISCVIPCYKSHASIGGVVDEIMETVATRSDGFEIEVILVNDGSTDSTMDALLAISRIYSNVVVVNLSKNYGQHAAIMAGFHKVSGDVVLCLDDDGQTPPSEMFRLIDKVCEGYDIAYARYHHKQHNFFRNLGSKFNTWCNHRFMGIPKDLQITSYFACKRFVVDNAIEYTNPYPFIGGLLFQSIQSYVNVYVDHKPRTYDKSGYSMKKLVDLWANGFTAFSVLPLRIATVTGFVVSLIGFIAVIIIVIQKLVAPDIDAGWSSIMGCILIVGGLLMLMIGMVGEYVGRIYISINKLPQFVVRSVVDTRGENASGGSQNLDDNRDEAPCADTPQSGSMYMSFSDVDDIPKQRQVDNFHEREGR